MAIRMNRKTFWKLGARGMLGILGFCAGYLLVKIIFADFPPETLNLIAGGFGGLVAMYFMFGSFIIKGITKG